MSSKVRVAACLLLFTVGGSSLLADSTLAPLWTAPAGFQTIPWYDTGNIPPSVTNVTEHTFLGGSIDFWTFIGGLFALLGGGLQIWAGLLARKSIKLAEEQQKRSEQEEFRVSAARLDTWVALYRVLEPLYWACSNSPSEGEGESISVYHSDLPLMDVLDWYQEFSARFNRNTLISRTLAQNVRGLNGAIAEINQVRASLVGNQGNEATSKLLAARFRGLNAQLNAIIVTLNTTLNAALKSGFKGSNITAGTIVVNDK